MSYSSTGTLMVVDKRDTTLRYAIELLGALPSERLGSTCVLDTGMGAEATRDFVALTRPVLTEWKFGWTSWLLSDHSEVSKKIGTLRDHDVTVIAGGTAGEIAQSRAAMSDYFALCASLEITRVEVGEGFIAHFDEPAKIVEQAAELGLDVQFEIGRKVREEDRAISAKSRLDTAKKWLDAGAACVVFEAREVGDGYSLMNSDGTLDETLGEALKKRFTLHKLVFEAPQRHNQVALLKFFGPGVNLANITPSELLRVESFRRGIHADTVGLRGAGTWSEFGNADH